MNKLKQLVQSVRVVPKKRRPTKPSCKSQEKRLRRKIQRGCTKLLRRRPSRSE
jgi:ribosome-associated protein